MNLAREKTTAETISPINKNEFEPIRLLNEADKEPASAGSSRNSFSAFSSTIRADTVDGVDLAFMTVGTGVLETESLTGLGTGVGVGVGEGLGVGLTEGDGVGDTDTTGEVAGLGDCVEVGANVV